MIGKRFNKLIVLKKAGIHIYPCGERVTKWKCQCECGNIVTVIRRNLINGNTQSCGCHNIQQIKKRFSKNLTGQKFNRLLVLRRISSINGTHYECLCDCGNTTIVLGTHLKNGNTKSCGCLNIERIVEHNKDPKIIARRKGKGYKIFEETHWRYSTSVFCRGTYERDVVRFLNKNKLDFEWQIPFLLSNGKTYIADLLLFNVYIEIKGYWWSDSKQKYQQCVKENPTLNFTVWDESVIKSIRNNTFNLGAIKKYVNR